jgi:hypothetical protein
VRRPRFLHALPRRHHAQVPFMVSILVLHFLVCVLSI